MHWTCITGDGRTFRSFADSMLTDPIPTPSPPHPHPIPTPPHPITYPPHPIPNPDRTLPKASQPNNYFLLQIVKILKISHWILYIGRTRMHVDCRRKTAFVEATFSYYNIKYRLQNERRRWLRATIVTIRINTLLYISYLSFIITEVWHNIG